jgi:hypothetical protein
LEPQEEEKEDSVEDDDDTKIKLSREQSRAIYKRIKES